MSSNVACDGDTNENSEPSNLAVNKRKVIKRNALTAAAADDVSTRRNAGPRNHTTPEKAASLGESAAATPPWSAGSHLGGPNSSCKRRRLASEDDENIAQSPGGGSFGGVTVQKLNYERNNSDAWDDSDDEDPFELEVVQMRNESILREIQRLKYEGGQDQVLHTTTPVKLLEYVKDYDVVALASGKPPTGRGKDDVKSAGEWKHRGSGNVKFIKCLEEGYNCGMIRQELIQNGTLKTLMCHELTVETVASKPSSRGKAYTWVVKDWGVGPNTVRTFAIQFDDDMEAIKWKSQIEQTKNHNCRVRKGLDVPGASAVDNFCSDFRGLSTSTL